MVGLRNPKRDPAPVVEHVLVYVLRPVSAHALVVVDVQVAVPVAQEAVERIARVIVQQHALSDVAVAVRIHAPVVVLGAEARVEQLVLAVLAAVDALPVIRAVRQAVLDAVDAGLPVQINVQVAVLHLVAHVPAVARVVQAHVVVIVQAHAAEVVQAHAAEVVLAHAAEVVRLAVRVQDVRQPAVPVLVHVKAQANAQTAVLVIAQEAALVIAQGHARADVRDVKAAPAVLAVLQAVQAVQAVLVVVQLVQVDVRVALEDVAKHALEDVLKHAEQVVAIHALVVRETALAHAAVRALRLVGLRVLVNVVQVAFLVAAAVRDAPILVHQCAVRTVQQHVRRLARLDVVRVVLDA